MDDIARHLEHVDGVMLGRAAYENPFLLTEVDKFFEGKAPSGLSRREIIQKLMSYVEEMELKGVPTNLLLRHTSGLFFDIRGSRQWKQLVNPPYPKGMKGRDLLVRALEVLPQDVLDERGI
jgi:tRNA-dihydrouridine synthase A